MCNNNFLLSGSINSLIFTHKVLNFNNYEMERSVIFEILCFDNLIR